MTQVREIKCPHCGEWTMWNGNIDDRCLFCDEFLEPQRFSREIEKKIGKELTRENDYFFIKPTDGTIKRSIKIVLNRLRWWVYYIEILFFIFITLVLLLITLFAG